MDDYNYAVFDLPSEDPVFAAFKLRMFVGERAPSFPLEDLATGQTVPMKSLWDKGLAILEFGSLT